jgi:hypothetical protein
MNTQLHHVELVLAICRILNSTAATCITELRDVYSNILCELSYEYIL